MSKILIYHHNDNDGYLSGAIAKDFHGYEPKRHEIKMCVGSYDGNENEDAIKWADMVYLLDYRLPIGLMDKYYDKIIWIDHHKTAIEQLQPTIDSKNKPLIGIRKIGEAGCLLTWKYFYGNIEIPLVVALVNDRDVWDWKLGEDTAAFHETTNTFMKCYDEWVKLMHNNDLTRKHLKHGHELLNYIRGVVDSYNESFAWEGNFEGYPVVFLNGSGVISGELHKRLREAHPQCWFAITFMVIQDRVNVGLYRTDGVTLDLGKIAVKYGGGGHEGAAGFYTDHQEWMQILKESAKIYGYKRNK